MATKNTALTRIERAELEHLRRVVDAHGARIEQLESDVMRLEDEAQGADRRADLFADLWRAECDRIIEAGGSPSAIGLTQSGELVRMEAQS